MNSEMKERALRRALGEGTRYHFVLAVPFDLEAMERGAERDENPRHILHAVSKGLDGVVHVPDPAQANRWDRVLAKLVGKPMHWALARRLVRDLDDGDVVYCAGDDVGLSLAISCRIARKRPALAIWVMEPSKKRFRWLVSLFRLQDRIARFVVNTPRKAMQLQEYLGIPAERIHDLREQTDLRFFSPGARSRVAKRPIIFSAGLERRDYRTLARATQDLDVDVWIAADSPNAPASLSTFPDPLPPNMSVRNYPWPEYRQAFRDCDLVVVPLLEADSSPGLTVITEAMACRKPVIATRTRGSTERLSDDGFVVGVRPGDPAELRAAILKLLGDPARAEAQAERAYRRALEHHDSRAVVDEMVLLMSTLSEPRR